MVKCDARDGWSSFTNMIAHLSDHNGGRNETAEKRHIPPGWTWWGRPQHSLCHQYEVNICSEVLPCKKQVQCILHTSFFCSEIRVSQLIGRQLAQIGDEMDYKWRERLPVLRQPLNFIGIYPYALTRRAFSGWVESMYSHTNKCERMFQMNVYVYNIEIALCRILGNIWGSKIMPMLRTSWLVPQLQNGCQEAKKWAAWVRRMFSVYK